MSDFAEYESNSPSLTVEQALANLQQKDDSGLRYYAAWWLGRFRVKEPEAITMLIDALGDQTDRTPDGGYPLRRNAATALGKLESIAAVPALIDCLACEDYYVRESAAFALEMIGDEQCIPALINLLDGGVEAAVQVDGKPHLRQPYEAILEALGTLGARNAILMIEPFLAHSTEKVQYAAARALYQLTGENRYGDRLIQALDGKDLQLRRSALMDLGAIGYLNAADPIYNTLAENSLKLIALKGLLENHLKQQSDALSDQSKHVMELMDGLL
ncbi:phycocyanobilin lyase [Aphanothece hegewaldii CCALA 016]|uniref:Phycocyanobilin lyase n=1 Tax=Aphanothece hegewaldii CCALA 016 TaxID=2107694 RepID=A0A2T1LZC9_9CHRO|nr:HEAT repeat domain-containing protein [Aphanothece hegewaldii]PSF37721.1 phycocyanobilin lyase [Aphanothece hegewaldii CCALA 016]